MTTSTEYARQIEELTIKMNEARAKEQAAEDEMCNTIFSNVLPAIKDFNAKLSKEHQIVMISVAYSDGTGKQFKV